MGAKLSHIISMKHRENTGETYKIYRVKFTIGFKISVVINMIFMMVI